MFRTYREVLSISGAPAFAAAGALARLPMSMLGIGLVLLVEAATGSYGTAGAVAGVFGLTTAIVSPLVSRAVDRFGQARVTLPTLAVHVVALAALLLAVHEGAPVWTFFVCVAVAGAGIGSLGSLVRARWSFALAGHEREATLLHTAYSLESVIDEVVFISGPLLITVLATRLSPTWGLTVAILAVAVGGTLLMLQRRTEPPPSGVRPAPGGGVLRAPGMVVLCVAMVCVGMIFGSMEVLAVAFAEERGHLDRAGWVLAVFAFGSLIAGLAYGSVQWRSGAGRRFRLGVVLLAAGVVPTLFVGTLPALAAVVFVAGFAISPMLISGNALVQELVAPARLTEGLTWTVSGIVIGVSTGAAVSGWAVDLAGARRGFAVPVAAGLLAAIVVLLCSRWLRPLAPADQPPDPPSDQQPDPSGHAPTSSGHAPAASAGPDQRRSGFTPPAARPGAVRTAPGRGPAAGRGGAARTGRRGRAC